MRTSHRLSALAGITTVGLTITVLGAGPADATTRSYVALDDSYSAGANSPVESQKTW